jgi:hypothetical protein
MQTKHHTASSIRSWMQELAEVLDRDWDTDFDTAYDDLEREFAELRLQMNHSE